MSGWSRVKAELMQRVKNAVHGVAHLRAAPSAQTADRLRGGLDTARDAEDRAVTLFAADQHDSSSGDAVPVASRTSGIDLTGGAIRRLSPDDWRVNKEIALAMGDDNPLDFRTGASGAERKTEPEYRADFDRIESFVAFRDGSPVGRTRLVHGDDPAMLTMAAVWVSPAARGAGIGDQLMTHAVNWARGHGYREIRLWVRENNEHATNLYLRHAFQFTGESRPHFADPSLRSVEMRHDLF